ncbi:Epoxide hydrolase 2 [Hondaea fermentalgiana]|uniref:Epoxide hydrolase 2 n=1 Tax=Hondaea fermentalgiana TaxID=2315210 RepID=A0A2R5G329_9STRA|nr:Epoxide hydrolase 2 [Hondaea fermentalgiana]|eukprot:GBG25437.1 Epoxide hydrolase 2 [Hondaea fermentalgiana]
MSEQDAPEWFTEAVDADDREEGRVTTPDGIELQYLRWRPLRTHKDDKTRDEDLQALVFVHGNGANAFWYCPTAPFFREDFDVIAISSSGCGDSGLRPDTYNIGHFANEILAVCDSLRLFSRRLRPILVGHSLGAIACTRLALDHGERFHGIVLCDIRVEDRPPEYFEKNKARSMRERAASPLFKPRDEFKLHPHTVSPASRFKLAPPQDTTPFVLDYIARMSANFEDKGWRWKGDPNRFRKLDLITHKPNMSLDDMRAANQKVPMAMVYGERSFFMTFRRIKETIDEKVAKLFPVFAIPHAEHHLLLDEPIAFVTALRALFVLWAKKLPSAPVDTAAATMESDSTYIPKQDNLDLIDEEWTMDALSDDEIELAPENDLALEDQEVDPTLPPTALHKDEEEEKWVDLGLETFVGSNSN